jgi:hypothetical protein
LKIQPTQDLLQEEDLGAEKEVTALLGIHNSIKSWAYKIDHKVGLRAEAGTDPLLITYFREVGNLRARSTNPQLGKDLIPLLVAPIGTGSSAQATRLSSSSQDHNSSRKVRDDKREDHRIALPLQCSSCLWDLTNRKVRKLDKEGATQDKEK